MKDKILHKIGDKGVAVDGSGYVVFNAVVTRTDKNGKKAKSYDTPGYYSDIGQAVDALIRRTANEDATDLKDWLAIYRRESGRVLKIVDEVNQKGE